MYGDRIIEKIQTIATWRAKKIARLFLTDSIPHIPSLPFPKPRQSSHKTGSWLLKYYDEVDKIWPPTTAGLYRSRERSLFAQGCGVWRSSADNSKDGRSALM